jgi:hypothetical protein
MHAGPNYLGRSLFVNHPKSLVCYNTITITMLRASVLLLALAAVGLAQVPDGYRTVYITSNVDPKFVIVAKARTAGSTTIVYVSPLQSKAFLRTAIP